MTTIKFSYICNYDETGPLTRTDEITIEKYGERGWQWQTAGQVFRGRTNELGNGLWSQDDDGWHQQQGTMQFSLPKNERAALYKLAKREASFWSIGGKFDNLVCEYVVSETSAAAALLGHRTSDHKAAASRANGAKSGGRPKSAKPE
jgi:hypothetical protein